VSDVQDELRHAFKAVSVALRRVRGRDTHRPGELSLAQYGLLFSVAGDRPRSSREIADEAALAPATVNQLLETLEAQGLVERTRSADDKRVVFTGLTARGHEVLNQRKDELEPRWQRVVAGLSDEELRVSAVVLRRLAAYLDDLD